MTRDLISFRLFFAPLAIAATCWLSACSNNEQGFIGNGTSSSGGSTSTTSSGSGGSTGVIITSTATKDGGPECDDGGGCYAVVDAGPYCGDGIIQQNLGEDCDDANRIGGDGCSGICKVEPNWECPTAGQPCKSLIVCGDGVRQTGEGCDDHNTNPGDGCDPKCKVEAGWFCATQNTPCQRLASCGDSRIASGESCDLGGDNGKGLGCDANCRQEDGWVCRPLPVGCKKVSVCGNRKVESGEDCDDGNTTSGDGCTNLCKIEGIYYDCPPSGGPCTDKSRCGNGVLEKQETCDDGNTTAKDGCDAGCKIEAGWQCRMAGKPCVPRCGDSVVTATETCDDGNTTSGDGCSSTCLVEPGAACTGTPSVCTKSVCGNGTTEAGESCDAGKEKNGLFYGDATGCSKTCTKEPNCRPNGTTQACSTSCGDGNVDSGEDCDDGNAVSGDGCSSSCKKEDGFTCTDNEVADTSDCSTGGGKCLVLPVTYRDFDGQQVSGGHPDFFFYGASASGGRTTGVVSGASTTTCVPDASGTKATFTAGAACPNTDQSGPCTGLVANDLDKDGKPVYAKGSCACVFTDWDKTGVLGTCPASGNGNCTPNTAISGVQDCWVEGEGSHRLRVDSTVTVIQSADTFKQWYRDSSTSTMVRGTLELANLTGTQYQFNSSQGRTITDDIHDIFMKTGVVTSLSSGFFPLEDQTRQKVCNLWPYWAANLSATTCVAQSGNPVGSQWDPKGSYTAGTAGTGGPVTPVTGMMRNFHFTSEVRYLFRYTGTGSSAAFYGDDDVWVFINGKLGLDLGAPHQRLQGAVAIDGAKFGLDTGKIYEIAVFHADRHPRDSNYQLTLSGFSTIRSVCQPRCGDGKTTAGEECDNGSSNKDGLYDGCTTNCKFGPFCGDGEVNGSEECDDGQNTTVTASSGNSKACGPGCKFPPKCGDGKVQTGEQCDDGASNANDQCGGCSSTCTNNPICGDGHVDPQCGEQCDDGANIGGYSYCKAGCVPDSRCGDKVVDAEYGETCDLGDQNGVADSSGKVQCTSTCGVPAVCGDTIVTPPETCDDGVNDGSYGGCTPDCQHAPYCGDGVKNGNEECDYGAANTPPTNALYGGCLTTCLLGPRCGDNITQNPPEQCDTAGDSNSCSANCVAKVKLL